MVKKKWVCEYIFLAGQDQGRGQDQGQDQDHLLLQRAALPHYLVLALTLVLVLRFFNYQIVPDIPSLITSLDLCSFYVFDACLCMLVKKKQGVNRRKKKFDKKQKRS